MGTTFVQNQIYKRVHAMVMKNSKGLYPAPLKIIDVSLFTLHRIAEQNCHSASVFFVPYGWKRAYREMPTNCGSFTPDKAKAALIELGS